MGRGQGDSEEREGDGGIKARAAQRPRGMMGTPVMNAQKVITSPG